MNDNEIIKALECCKVCSSPEYCGECPYVECTTVKGCVDEMLTDALNLINRQKAEIERLEKLNIIYKGGVDYFKSEAIKEFAERLKDIYTLHEGLHKVIDNLMEEMSVNYESSKNDTQRKEDEK